MCIGPVPVVCHDNYGASRLDGHLLGHHGTVFDKFSHSTLDIPKILILKGVSLAKMQL